MRTVSKSPILNPSTYVVSRARIPSDSIGSETLAGSLANPLQRHGQKTAFDGKPGKPLYRRTLPLEGAPKDVRLFPCVSSESQTGAFGRAACTFFLEPALRSKTRWTISANYDSDLEVYHEQ